MINPISYHLVDNAEYISYFKHKIILGSDMGVVLLDNMSGIMTETVEVITIYQQPGLAFKLYF